MKLDLVSSAVMEKKHALSLTHAWMRSGAPPLERHTLTLKQDLSPMQTLRVQLMKSNSTMPWRVVKEFQIVLLGSRTTHNCLTKPAGRQKTTSTLISSELNTEIDTTRQSLSTNQSWLIHMEDLSPRKDSRCMMPEIAITTLTGATRQKFILLTEPMLIHPEQILCRSHEQFNKLIFNNCYIP